MGLRTTLVYPAITIKGFGGLLQGMDGGWISHGLASISAAAKAAGFTIDLIDLRALKGWDHFRQVLQERKPRVLGFTMMSADSGNVRTASALAKSRQRRPGNRVRRGLHRFSGRVRRKVRRLWTGQAVLPDR